MKKIALAAALIGTMSAASAQVYLAGNIGQARFEVDCPDNFSCDKSDTGYKLTAGYQLTPLVALEASYVDFSKAKGTVSGPGGNATLRSDTSGYLLAAAMRHNVTPEVALVGRLGLSFLKSKNSGTVSSTDSSDFSKSKSFDSTKPYLGLGAEYALTNQLRLTVGVDFTEAKIADDVDREFGVTSTSTSVRLLSAGVQYAF
jgi:predicted porin